MSDPLIPPGPQPPSSTGTGHIAFVSEGAVDPFAFVSSANVPTTQVSLPPFVPHLPLMQPSLASDGGGGGRGTELPTGPSLMGEHHAARQMSQAESDGGCSPGLLPSPTSAFSPYHVDHHHAHPSLLEDPPSIMFSNVTILAPSPVPPSPDKKDSPPKTGGVPGWPATSLAQHSGSVHSGSSEAQQLPTLPVAPTGKPLGVGEGPHPQHQVEMPHPQHQVELPRRQHQVELPQPQHQVEVPHPQQQVEVPRPQYQVDVPHPQHHVTVPRPQHQVDLPHPQHQVDVPRPQHQVEVPHPQHHVTVPHPLHQVEVPHPQQQVEVPRPQYQVEVPRSHHQVDTTPPQHKVDMPHPQPQVDIPHPQPQVEVPHPQHQVEVPRPQHPMEMLQHRVQVPHPQHPVETLQPQNQVEVPHSQPQVEVPRPQHQVDMPHPQHQVDMPHPQHLVDMPHPQHQVDMPHPQHQVDMPHPQHLVDMPHPQHLVDMPHPQHQVDMPHPQHQGPLPSVHRQEGSPTHLLHNTSQGTLAPPPVNKDIVTLSPIPPAGMHPTVSLPAKPTDTRQAAPEGLIAFGDHPSEQQQTTSSLPLEGLQGPGRMHPGPAYEKGVSRQASEGFTLEPPAPPSQAPSSGPPSHHHSPIDYGTPAERSNAGQREDLGLESFTEPTPSPDVRPSHRSAAYRDARPVHYDDQSDRHSYYEGERGRPPYYDQWSRYERPPYSSHHHHERDRRHYYGHHGYQQDHHGNQRYRHYGQHHYDYDPYHHHRYYDDWEYAWQQQQDRDPHYDRSRYTDPRQQRGYPSDYWRGGDRRHDSQYNVHDNSSVYDASQSWVDPASASHISGYGHYDSLSYTDGHTREEYSMYDSQYERWEGENPGNYPTEEWIQSTAGYPTSEPVRDTPLLFAQPHAPARFGVGGVLFVVTPTSPSQYSAATVELHSVQELVPEYQQFAASVESNPGPLIPGETPKSAVASFVSEEAARSRETAEKSEDSESREGWKERALLWEYLLLLCRQNGVVVPSDLCELLTRDAGVQATSFELAVPAKDTPQSEKLHQFRMLILSGRKKDALDHACRQGLWGHALMVAMTMEEQSRQYVVNRFTASLLSSDPLNTFYTLMLGRMPTVSKPDGLTRGGDWRPHLSVMLSNRNASDGTAAIVSLGDSLLSRGRLFAAHFCYKVAELEFGGYSESDCKYSLLGVDPRTLDVGQYPSLNQLAMTEVYEYAMTLGQNTFSLPKFQLFKFLHIWQLVEAGLPVKALGYCEVTAVSCLKCPELINPSVLYQLAELSVRLHFCVHGGGVVHNKLPQWIIELCKVIPSQESQEEGHTLPVGQQEGHTLPVGQQEGHTLPVGQQEGHTLPKGLQTPQQESCPRSSPIASGHFGDSTGQAALTQPVDVEDGAESTSGDLALLGSSSQMSVHSSVSQQQPQQEDHVHSGRGHQEDAKNAETQPPPQGLAPIDQPPAPEDSGYSQVPGGYGTQQNQQHMNYQTSAIGGLYQEQYGYDQQLQVGAQQGYGAPPSQGHVTAPQSHMTGAPPSQGRMTGAPPSQGHMTGAPPSQEHLTAPHGHMTGAPPSQEHLTAPHGHMTGAPPSQGHVTGAPPSQGHMTGAPPSQGQAYVTSTPNATTGYAMMTPMVPQQYAEPTVPPSSQDRQQTDLGQERNEDEDTGKGEDSSKPTSGGVMHFFRNLFPKRGGAYLPDDKPEDKKIVWDPEKKKWINKDAGEEGTDAPPPPPTDMELRSKMQQQPSMPAAGITGPGALTQAAPGSTAPQQGLYGHKGRRGRSKYVDVFGGLKSTSQFAPPPPAMPLGGGQAFTGNFFVPTATAASGTAGPGESMAYFSGTEQPFPTTETGTTAAQPS